MPAGTAYYIGVGGGNLYKIDTNGVLTQLTLPSGVTIDATKIARSAVFGRNIIIVNAPNQSIWVDPNANVRTLTIQSPGAGQLVAGAAGTLTGTYQFKYTYTVKDTSTGTLLMESDFSAVSNSLAITNQYLQANVQTSWNPNVNGRRLYRTTTGGTTYFKWVDIDDNTIQSVSDLLSDTLLSNIAAPTELGTAIGGTIPNTHMTLITSWRGRLWTVSDTDIDTLRYSGNNLLYGWPATYGLTVAPVGADQYGITGLFPRKEYLGVARRRHLWRVQFQGTNSDGSPNFSIIIVNEGKGCFAPDTAIVIRDVAYMLGEDGIYAWPGRNKEFECISDIANVRKWFATDTYFNRSLFPNAFAKYNPVYDRVEFHLASVGSTAIDRWVEYDITKGQFYGPHKTDAFTPTYAREVIDPTTSIPIPMVGATDGNLYQPNQFGVFNDNGTSINMDWIGKMHDCGTPDISKVFLQPTIINKATGTVGNLQVIPTYGDETLLTTGPTLTPDLSVARNRLARITQKQPARLLQLEFKENTINQGCEVHGYEVTYNEIGRR